MKTKFESQSNNTANILLYALQLAVWSTPKITAIQSLIKLNLNILLCVLCQTANWICVHVSVCACAVCTLPTCKQPALIITLRKSSIEEVRLENVHLALDCQKTGPFIHYCSSIFCQLPRSLSCSCSTSK